MLSWSELLIKRRPSSERGSHHQCGLRRESGHHAQKFLEHVVYLGTYRDSSAPLEHRQLGAGGFGLHGYRQVEAVKSARLLRVNVLGHGWASSTGCPHTYKVDI